jgi:TATA-box binding protein (TBP) (component of TFIID and TFIIIB)
MHSSSFLKEAKVRVVNVVATVDLKQPVNLALASRLEGAIYSPDKYQGRVVYFKSKGMQGKVTLFSTGKMISVGTTSVEQAKRELQNVANLLAAAGLVRRVRVKLIVRNFVVSVDLGRPPRPRGALLKDAEVHIRARPVPGRNMEAQL